MLSGTSKLYFPKIVYEKTVQPKASTDARSSSPLSLYKLDWTRKENKANKCQSDFSDEFETTIHNFRFAIPDSYLREIRRMSWKAVEEFNTTRLIHDSMKYIYLRPASEYICSSMLLLMDCLYDEEKEYYYRGDDKTSYHILLLYKFWKSQVNKQLLQQFSNIETLQIYTHSTPFEDKLKKVILTELANTNGK